MKRPTFLSHVSSSKFYTEIDLYARIPSKNEIIIPREESFSKWWRGFVRQVNELVWLISIEIRGITLDFTKSIDGNAAALLRDSKYMVERNDAPQNPASTRDLAGITARSLESFDTLRSPISHDATTRINQRLYFVATPLKHFCRRAFPLPSFSFEIHKFRGREAYSVIKFLIEIRNFVT